MAETRQGQHGDEGSDSNKRGQTMPWLVDVLVVGKDKTRGSRTARSMWIKWWWLKQGDSGSGEHLDELRWLGVGVVCGLSWFGMIKRNGGSVRQ